MILCSPRHKKVTSAICEAYNCNRDATDQVKVNAGVFGDVNLNLCKNCIPKFSNRVKYGVGNHTSLVREKKELFNNDNISTA
jgi:hypothetical protein